MDSRTGHRMSTSLSLANAMQEHQRELARLERIRLDQPRPDADRFANDYVDAPKLPQKKQARPALPDTNSPKTPTTKCSHALHSDLLDTDHFLTKQPRSSDIFPTAKKIPCAIHGRRDGEEDLKKQFAESKNKVQEDSAPGIICPECGKCRCSACITPKGLPSYWLCNGTFQCSAESLVDHLSCLCCVKGLFYHLPSLSGGADDQEDTENPCTCAGSRSCQRWTVMGVLAVTCLPCLLCYWPCKAAASVSAKCYAAYHRRGCRCGNSPSALSSTDSSPVTSIRKMTPVPPTRPGHARRVTSSQNGVFL